MKGAIVQGLLCLPTASLVVLSAMSAQAQFMAIPISNGSFALQGTAGGGTMYSTPLTVLSPAGTINFTSVPLPLATTAPLITTNTAIGLYFVGVSGTANLNDGRTANFPAGQGYVKLEALGTVAGAANSAYQPTVPGVTVNYTVQTGSLVVPQNNVTAFPTPQFDIPVTGGTFTINSPATAQADTITLTGLLTPIGTANITVTFPDLSTPTAPDVEMSGTNQSLLLTGLANGSVALNDGRVGTVTNRLFTFTGTGRVSTGTGFWYGEQLQGTPATIEGTIAAGSISVPQTAVALPPPPPQPPTQIVPPLTGGNSGTGPSVTPITQPMPVATGGTTPSDRPVPMPAAPPTLAFSFASSLNLGGEPNVFATEEQQAAIGGEIPEVDRSSLEFSRIHPMVNVYTR